MTFLRPGLSGFPLAFTGVLLSFLVFPGLSLEAQSPDQELWMSFLSRPPREAAIPEDDELGLLADLRNPAGAWAGSISVCEAVFLSLSEGQVPSEYLAPDLEVLLFRDFETVLEAGVFQAGRRYGLPARSGDRLNVPVRLSSDNRSGIGHIYLIRIEGVWLVEQWALDLTPFIVEREVDSPEE